MHTLYLKILFIQHLSCISMSKNHMCIESISLKINSQRFLSSSKKRPGKRKEYLKRSAIQVQILNKLSVSQKSDILGKTKQNKTKQKPQQLVSKHQFS